MDMHPKLKALGEHFAIIWIMVATIGYVILRSIGQLDFRQYVVFLGILLAVYVVLKKQFLFWFLLISCVLYVGIIKTNFTNSPTVTKIDTVFSKSVHDVAKILKSTVK